jgi:hypothetical protein
LNLCDICGTRHHAYQAHVFATNRIATNTSATNKAVETKDAESGAGLRGVGDVPEPANEGAEKTRNRRTREAYNAYQREYMRRRRAKAA